MATRFRIWRNVADWRERTQNPSILSIQSEKGGIVMSEPKPKVAGLYVRISTSNGRQDSTLQKNELRALAERRGWSIFKIYEDHESGARRDRPEFAEILRDCRQGKLDLVATWSIDRLARSMSQLVGTLEILGELGIDFVSLRQEGMDTTTSTGKLIFHVIASVAEFERELLRERVVAGMHAARCRGRRIGRPKKKELSAAEIEQIGAARRKKGVSIRALAHQFGATEYAVNQVLSQRAAAT
jgi:DNA invertase Pin-like site-specific DNA recombinase